MRKIRIAQIGVNSYSHSNDIFSGLQKRSDLFDIAGYALPEGERERLPQRARELAAYPALTVEEILRDPTIEAVTVETDEPYLTDYALMAAKAGKHIHMEKPGGRELAAFDRLIAAVKQAGTVFHTGYMYRYNPSVQHLLARIKRGELGEIISVEAQMNCFHPAAVRQWLDAFPGGMMFFLGCHLIDLIYQIQGKPDRIVPLNACTGLDGVTAQDFGIAALVYPNGVSFAKTCACERGGFQRRQLVVTGSKGTVELRPLEWYEDGLIRTGRTQWYSDNWHESGAVDRSERFDRYDTMLAEFAAYVRGDKKNPYSPDYERELYKTILLCCGMKEEDM